MQTNLRTFYDQLINHKKLETIFLYKERSRTRIKNHHCKTNITFSLRSESKIERSDTYMRLGP